MTDEEKSSGLFRLRTNLSLDAQTTYTGLDSAEGVAFDSAHNRVFVADEDVNEIEIFDGSTLDHIATVDVGFQSDGPYWLGVDGSSNHLFVLGDSKRSANASWGIHVFNITSGGDGLTFNTTLVGSGGADQDCFGALTVSEATDRLFAIDFCSDKVEVFDTSDLSSLGSLPQS